MAKPLRLRVRRKSVVWWPVVTRSNHIKYCAMLVRWIGLCMMLPEVSFSCILPVTRIAKIHRLPEGERPQRGLIATVGNFLLPSAHGCRFRFKCSAHVRSTELTCSSQLRGFAWPQSLHVPPRSCGRFRVKKKTAPSISSLVQNLAHRVYS